MTRRRKDPPPRYAPGSRAGAGGKPRLDPAGLAEPLLVHLDRETREQLDRLAAASGETLSAVVRAAIRREARASAERRREERA